MTSRHATTLTRTRGTQLCAYCAREGKHRQALAQCAWPVDSKVAIPFWEAKVGDVWFTHQRGLRARIFAIEAIDNFPLNVAARFWVEIPGHKDPYPYSRQLSDTIWTEKSAHQCSVAICYRHRRHVGPGRNYCVDHWSAWETLS